MKTVSYTTAARKSLRSLPDDLQEQIRAKLAKYAQTGGGNVTRLVGRPGARLRVGDYRAIFVEGVDGLTVVAVGHRRDIYG